jgi:hypothetical protein
VAELGLRRAAKRIGMAPSWLSGFIGEPAAEKDPRDTTLKKLREWFLRDGARWAEQDAHVARAAAAYLVDGLHDPAERGAARAELLALLRRHYGRRGPPPKWLGQLESEDE